MKLSFDFDPCSHEDMSKMSKMIDGSDYFSILYDIDQLIRAKLKYDDLEGWPSDVVNFLQNLRDEINAEVDFSE